MNIEPENLDLLQRMVDNLIAQNKLDTAIQFCDKIITINETNERALCSKALILHWQQKSNEAIKFCDRVLELSPNRTQIKLVKLISLANCDRKNEAMDDLP